MDPKAMLWNAPRPPARQPKPRERLFALTKDHHQTICELCHHGEFGVESQFLRDGELVIGRRFDTRALAVQWAEQEGEALMRDGWTSQQLSPEEPLPR